MGCSNIKGANEFGLIKKKQAEKKKEILNNPHNEDEVAEQINPGKSSKTKKENALDELTKTTLAEPSLLSKTLPVDLSNLSNVSVVHPGHSVNLKKSMIEKPSFPVFDHRFDFDLDLEIPKDSAKENNQLIEEVLNDLKSN